MDRKEDQKDDSYTSILISGGPEAIGKKILEESQELQDAAIAGDRQEVIHEAADLLYHTWVLLGSAGVRPEEVREELVRRFGTSGLKEKKNRK